MLQDLYTFTIKLKKYSFPSCKLGLRFFIVLLLSSCSLFQSKDENTDRVARNHNFPKGEALVLSREYDKALPFLAASLKEGNGPDNRNYDLTLLYSARAYDQLGVPDKAILALNEFLTKPFSRTEEIQARSLILKNYAKQGLDITSNNEKMYLEQAIKMKEGESSDILRGLDWSMDFSCDQFCVAELKFLKEIQLQYIYLIEKDAAFASTATQILQQRYQYFYQFLKKDYLQLPFRREIAAGLLDSLQRLNNLHLALPNQSSIRTAQLINSLQTLGKDTESWLYQ